MARRVNTEDEHVTVLGQGPIPNVGLPPIEEQGNAVIGRAADHAPARPPGMQLPAPPKRYRVIKGGMIAQGGYRTLLREGKEIDGNNYDVRDLQRQGIRLERIEEPKPEETYVPID